MSKRIKKIFLTITQTMLLLASEDSVADSTALLNVNDLDSNYPLLSTEYANQHGQELKQQFYNQLITSSEYIAGKDINLESYIKNQLIQIEQYITHEATGEFIRFLKGPTHIVNFETNFSLINKDADINLNYMFLFNRYLLLQFGFHRIEKPLNLEIGAHNSEIDASKTINTGFVSRWFDSNTIASGVNFFLDYSPDINKVVKKSFGFEVATVSTLVTGNLYSKPISFYQSKNYDITVTTGLPDLSTRLLVDFQFFNHQLYSGAYLNKKTLESLKNAVSAHNFSNKVGAKFSLKWSQIPLVYGTLNYSWFKTKNVKNDLAMLVGFKVNTTTPFNKQIQSFPKRQRCMIHELQQSTVKRDGVLNGLATNEKGNDNNLPITVPNDHIRPIDSDQCAHVDTIETAAFAIMLEFQDCESFHHTHFIEHFQYCYSKNDKTIRLKKNLQGCINASARVGEKDLVVDHCNNKDRTLQFKREQDRYIIISPAQYAGEYLGFGEDSYFITHTKNPGSKISEIENCP